MEELDYEKVKVDRETQEALRQPVREKYDLPDGFTGVKLGVFDGDGRVILQVNGTNISMDICGARDLALALRQSANRIEKSLRKK